MRLLYRLQKIAVKLRIIQEWFFYLTIGLLLLFVYILVALNPQSGNHYILPLLISMVWSLSVYSFIQVFAVIDLSTPEKNSSWWIKFKAKIRRLFHFIIILAFLSTTMTGLVMTWRLINIWLKDYQ